MSRDRFLPRQFLNQGDRLAFSNGILILSVLAATLRKQRRESPEKLTRLQQWIVVLNGRIGYHKTLVAIANKHAVFVDFTAAAALREIGIKYTEPAPRSTPIPWFRKHVDTHKKQTALQENESVNYVIGAMTDTINYNELPQI